MVACKSPHLHWLTDYLRSWCQQTCSIDAYSVRGKLSCKFSPSIFFLQMKISFSHLINFSVPVTMSQPKAPEVLIHILGGVGSGRTTFMRRVRLLSDQFLAAYSHVVNNIPKFSTSMTFSPTPTTPLSSPGRSEGSWTSGAWPS